MIENGVTWRNAETIRKKIGREEDAWRKGDALRNKTGQGSWMSATEMKTANGWADDDPEWLKIKKVALAPILKKSKYFFELEPVFSTRHANVRLAAAHGLPANDEDVGNNGPIERDPREHLVLSNAAYDAQPNVQDGIHSRSVSPGMDEFRSVLDENGELCEDRQAPYTPTPLRPPESPQTQTRAPVSSSSLKRTSSRNSWESGSQSTFSKRGQTCGSASSIQGLLQERNVGSSEAQTNNNSKSFEHEAFVKHGQSMERLAQVVESMGNSIYGPNSQEATLTPEELKQKSKLELEMINVKLSTEKFDLDSRKEKHQLEMKHLKAELEHQQVARHAQLLGTLMKDHNLNIQNAMLAAQSAQAMIQTTHDLTQSQSTSSSNR
ncbi:hypothetical protein DFH28DRAFT_1079446 [Melampsora americana]|nr:hypothetical protein DFH28DRAFT_1079446 [Melampsora americana]